jgi:hypothetical protein
VLTAVKPAYEAAVKTALVEAARRFGVERRELRVVTIE